MIAAEHINEFIPYLSPNDSVQKAIDWMEEYKLQHLPVVDEKKCLGLLAENTIFEAYDFSAKINTFPLVCENVGLFLNNHVYDAIHLFHKHEISLVPIVNKKLEYVGVISIYDIINSLSDISSFKNIGAIVVLKIRDYNYSLHEISRIVESNNVKILSSHIQESSEVNFIEVTLKLNTKSIDAVVASFERYCYNIIAIFHRDISSDSDEDKLDHFFKFLNI